MLSFLETPGDIKRFLEIMRVFLKYGWETSKDVKKMSGKFPFLNKLEVKQQGMEVYQVIGSPKKQPASSYNTDNIVENFNPSTVSEEIQEESDEDIDLNVEITEEDIKLVSMQTGVTPKEAERALKETNGDLARAIINLKTK